MEVRYCWRCRTERGYLDDVEAREVDDIQKRSFARDFDGLTGFELLRARLTPAVERYVSFTGEEVGPNLAYRFHVIFKHRLSELGPGCPACARPLRTPRAKICANCGWPHS